MVLKKRNERQKASMKIEALRWIKININQKRKEKKDVYFELMSIKTVKDRLAKRKENNDERGKRMNYFGRECAM